MRTLRPLLAALALVLAGCGTTAGSDRPEQDATLLLDGPPAAVDAGIASTAARGYDEAEGVTLRIRAAPRGADNARALLAGQADVAVMDLNDLAASHGIVAVMAITQQPLLALLGPPAPPRGARESRPALVAALTRRRHGAPLGRWDLAPPGIRLLHVEDAGVPPYPELVLAATRTNLREEPDVIRAAVRALARGYRFTLTDPESSLQDLVGRFPGLDAARARAALGRLTAAFLGDAGAPGVLDARQLSRWSAWARAHGLPSGVPADPRYALAAARSASG